MSNTSNIHRRVIKDITEGRTKLMEECGIHLAPEENNMYNVHFVMPGPDETPFEGGLYHGMIRLNPSHPLLPPNVYMFTPSGRFKVSEHPVSADNRGICFSYSSYHPEMWTPVNDIYKVMIGFISFMTDLKDYGAGCVENPTDTNIRSVSKKSIAAVKKDPCIKLLFPDLCNSLMNDSYVPPKMGELNKKVNKVPSKVDNNMTTSVSSSKVGDTSTPKTSLSVPSKNKPAIKKITNKSESEEENDSQNEHSSGGLLDESDESNTESELSESEEKPVKNKVTKKAATSKPTKKPVKKTVTKVHKNKKDVKKTNKRN